MRSSMKKDTYVGQKKAIIGTDKRQMIILN